MKKVYPFKQHKMLDSSPDPKLISFSTSVYRTLLAFYPPRFKQEYGTHMVQVFRDCCLKTYSQFGTRGMLRLWAFTLFDWLKTVIEEQFQRDTVITKDKFIRLSAGALMLGAFTFVLGSFTLQLGGDRQFYIRVFGAAMTTAAWNIFTLISQNLFIAFYLMLAGVFLIMLGLIGVWSHPHYAKNIWGRMILLIACAGGATIIIAGVLTGMGLENAWWGLMIGIVSFYVSLATFGLFSSYHTSFSVWHGFLLVGYLYFASMIVPFVLPETLSSSGTNTLTTLSMFLMNMPNFGLFLLGYKLLSATPKSAPIPHPSI